MTSKHAVAGGFNRRSLQSVILSNFRSLELFSSFFHYFPILKNYENEFASWKDNLTVTISLMHKKLHLCLTMSSMIKFSMCFESLLSDCQLFFS